jgi:hypothetical protein
VTSPPRRACSYEATRGPGLVGVAAGRRTGRPVEVKAQRATIKSGQTGLQTHREHRRRILTVIKCEVWTPGLRLITIIPVQPLPPRRFRPKYRTNLFFERFFEKWKVFKNPSTHLFDCLCFLPPKLANLL